MKKSGSEINFLREAIKLARRGMEKGDGGPFGAVIVKDGLVVGRGWNQVLKTNDPTAHAEVVAIRDACSRLSSYWLDQCHLYVSCEPCPMCLGAIYWARLESLTFCATRKDAAAIGFADDHIYDQISLSPEKRDLVTTYHRLPEAAELLREWPALAGDKAY